MNKDDEYIAFIDSESNVQVYKNKEEFLLNVIQYVGCSDHSTYDLNNLFKQLNEAFARKDELKELRKEDVDNAMVYACDKLRSMCSHDPKTGKNAKDLQKLLRLQR